jgi:all-trans-8'-apo-beta-carotenal 15,15'-oxygenase
MFQTASECPKRTPLEVVHGAIPAALRGTAYKVGPGRFGVGGEEYAHWLDGDGYVFALDFSDGGASYVSRFVQTAGYLEEQEQITWRTTFGTQRRGGPLANAFDLKLKNPANTNILPIPGRNRVLALWEAGAPHALDAHTLETIGCDTIDGRVETRSPGALPLDLPLPFTGDAVSAHYAACATTNRSVAWSWRRPAVGGDLFVKLHELDDVSGRAVGGVDGVLEGVSFAPHDIGATPTKACFLAALAAVEVLGYVLGFRGPAQGVFFDKKRIRAGEGTTLHALDRTSGGKAERYVCPEAYHPVHVACAYDGSSGPRMIAACWPPNVINARADGKRDILGDWVPLLNGDFSGAAVTQLVRFKGSRDGSATARILCRGAHLDHCKVHPAAGGLKSRFVYASAGAAVAFNDVEDPTYASPQPPQAFVRVDVNADAVVDAWFCGERRFVDDAVLVAIGDEETDAYLIAPVFNAATQRTTMVVLDCGDLSAGPLCELALPAEAPFIPWGLHGAWSPS